MRPESVVAGLICQDLQALAPRGAKMSVGLAACWGTGRFTCVTRPSSAYTVFKTSCRAASWSHPGFRAQRRPDGR